VSLWRRGLNIPNGVVPGWIVGRSGLHGLASHPRFVIAEEVITGQRQRTISVDGVAVRLATEWLACSLPFLVS
jgi:hypothetical protein